MVTGFVNQSGFATSAWRHTLTLGTSISRVRKRNALNDYLVLKFIGPLDVQFILHGINGKWTWYITIIELGLNIHEGHI